MKFENLYIKCENLEQRDEVIRVCLDSGITRYAEDLGDFNICVEGGEFFDFDVANTSALQVLSHSQFMSKYGKLEMKQSIEKAMTELKMGREELSCMLGFSRQYITKMLTRPQSEKTQNKVIKMIDDLMQSVDSMRQLGGAFCDNSTATNDAEKAIKELNQALSAKIEAELYKQINRANAYKEDNLKLSLKISFQQKSIEDKTNELLEIKLLNSDLSSQVEVLKRKNKEMDNAYMVVCIILTALAVWGFYV